MSHELQAMSKPTEEIRSLPEAASSVEKLELAGHVETTVEENNPPSYSPEEERNGKVK